MDYKGRDFIKTAAAGAAAVTVGPKPAFSPDKNLSVEVVHPRNRIPVSLIIDDPTTLVNMAYFGIPQFAEVFPENYKQDWRILPREIPDSFVGEFGERGQEVRSERKIQHCSLPGLHRMDKPLYTGLDRKSVEG